jgi:capsular polysaccharide transport system ATP-binding protein
MRARLAFGVSLAIDFECYLVDEITAVGDSRFQRRSKAAFKEKLEHANIIMVSHSNNTLRDYCDMGAVLHDGRLTIYDDLKDAISQHEANQSR